MTRSSTDWRFETYLDSLTRFGIRPGLERIRFLVERGGHPERSYPAVLVGGTNGKGSVVEYLCSIAVCAGLRVGAYTSPHLYRYNERIRIGDEFISDGDLARLLGEAQPLVAEAAAAEGIGQPTEFEVLTFIAFRYFAEQQVDLALLEVGLGGKWDATNVTEPVVSALTNVALDHTERLGTTVQAIAADKAAIARPGRLLITAEESPDTLEILSLHCVRTGTQLMLARGERLAMDLGRDPPVQTAILTTAARIGDRFTTRLLGESQPSNQAVAVALADDLRRQGFGITEEAICEGIARAYLPGRFEVLRTKPTLLIDGANNEAGVRDLVQTLRSAYPDRQVLLIFGASADKRIEAMLAALAPLPTRVLATQANHPRAAPAEEIARLARKFHNDVESTASVKDAVGRAMELADEDTVVCVTGSFFVIAEVERGPS